MWTPTLKHSSQNPPKHGSEKTLTPERCHAVQVLQCVLDGTLPHVVVLHTVYWHGLKPAPAYWKHEGVLGLQSLFIPPVFLEADLKHDRRYFKPVWGMARERDARKLKSGWVSVGVGVLCTEWHKWCQRYLLLILLLSIWLLLLIATTTTNNRIMYVWYMQHAAFPSSTENAQSISTPV